MKSGSFGHDLGLLVGRVLLAALYLPFGVMKLQHWSHTVATMQAVHAPMPLLAAAVAVFCETLVPVLLILGFRTWQLSVIMIFYTAGATYLAHRFWLMPADQALEAEINFFKNAAIIGGFLLLAISGPGKFSTDSR